MSKILRAFVENETSIRRVLARYFNRADDIDDLAQETFLRGFAAELKMTIREPTAFLLRVAKNLALSELKKRRNADTDYLEEKASSEVLVDKSAPSIEDQFDGRRKFAAFAKALASLPEPYRRALLMRKMDHLRFKQIAKRLNVSVSTVEKRVASALILCNARLREEGYDPREFGAQPVTEKKSGVDSRSDNVIGDAKRCESDV